MTKPIVSVIILILLIALVGTGLQVMLIKNGVGLLTRGAATAALGAIIALIVRYQKY